MVKGRIQRSSPDVPHNEDGRTASHVQNADRVALQNGKPRSNLGWRVKSQNTSRAAIPGNFELFYRARTALLIKQHVCRRVLNLDTLGRAHRHHEMAAAR